MKKKITTGAAISIMFVAMTLTFCLTMVLSTKIFESKVDSVTQKEAIYDKISEIDTMVRQYFYSDIDDSRVLESISNGYVKGLGDGESKYYSADELIIYQNVLNGKILGVGADIIKSRENSGYMQVYIVYSGSPADVAGIATGDLISAIDGVSTINMSLDSAKSMLEGTAGSQVAITYLREGTENTATVTRKTYDAPSLSYQKSGDNGYIKIRSFEENTASLLDYATRSLLGQGATSIVIDLRNNQSQNYTAAAEAADVLLPEGTIMNAVYKDGETKVLYTSDKASVNLPYVVITDNTTGYAAEMFTIMMKDSAGAKTVGTTTMGKGLLKKMYRLTDGSGVELTVGALVPTVSQSFNGTGIVADYEKTIDTSLENWYNLPFESDPQIQRALEVASNLVTRNSRDNSTAGEGEGNTEGETTDGNEENADGENSQSDESNSQAE